MNFAMRYRRFSFLIQWLLCVGFQISQTSSFYKPLIWNQKPLSAVQKKSIIDTSCLNPFPVWTQPCDKISSMLVCGDGDMSYAASIAEQCHQLNIDFTVSVLEDEATHNRVYDASKNNAATILDYKHTIMFGIDATKLLQHYPTTVFDRIVFNFPHWKGKSNHKHNRALIDAFLSSAAQVLSHRGEIHIALCQGQGGNHAQNTQQWKDSWTISVYAAEHGLLHTALLPFYPNYKRSSFRGRDKGFHVGEAPDLYIFAKPNRIDSVLQHLRLCCRQELHILLPDDDTVLRNTTYTLDQVKNENAILQMIRSVIPSGISVDVPARKIWFKEETGYPTDIAVFLVVYCGTEIPMTRDDGNEFRRKVEDKIAEVFTLRENRKGRLVSKPFPHTLLDYILKVHSSYGHMKNSYHPEYNYMID